MYDNIVSCLYLSLHNRNTGVGRSQVNADNITRSSLRTELKIGKILQQEKLGGRKKTQLPTKAQKLKSIPECPGQTCPIVTQLRGSPHWLHVAG